MSKLKSFEELKKFRDQLNQEANVTNQDKIVIAVGMATCGVAAGARDVMNTIAKRVEEKGLSNVSVVATGCLGFCYAEPMVEVRKSSHSTIRYGNVNPDVALEIVDKHIVQGTFVDNNIFTKGVPIGE